jgi:hypothetical protein
MDKNKKNQWRTVGKKLFDIACLSQYREGKLFDEEFYKDQKTGRNLGILSTMNERYLLQQQENELKKKERKQELGNKILVQE